MNDQTMKTTGEKLIRSFEMNRRLRPLIALISKLAHKTGDFSYMIDEGPTGKTRIIVDLDIDLQETENLRASHSKYRQEPIGNSSQDLDNYVLGLRTLGVDVDVSREVRRSDR